MNEFLLTDNEQYELARAWAIHNEWWWRDLTNAIAKAQAKKLVEWMAKNNIRTEWSEKTDKKWQSLLKGVGVDNAK